MVRKLVNFRLPEELIEQLKERANSERITVTELIVRYCKSGLQDSVPTPIPIIDTVKTDVKTDELYSMIDAAISPLQEQIDALRVELGKYVV